MPSRRVIAVFDERDAAENARDELLELGLERDRVSIVDRGHQEFSGRAASGEKVGFWTHLKEMFMPDEDRATLDESIRRGSYVLSASVADERADEVIQCLEDAGAVDLEQRASEWRAAGWSPSSASASASDQLAGDRTEDEGIPIVEERLRVGKREINRGNVRVRSFIVEEPVHEQVRLREEHVEIERRPVSEPSRSVAQGSSGDLLQERTIEVSETAEQAVVAKEAIVKEEVLVRKTTGERVEDIEDTVRRTEVEIEDGRTNSTRSNSEPKSPSAR